MFRSLFASIFRSTRNYSSSLWHVTWEGLRYPASRPRVEGLEATETCRAILQLPINILLDCIKLVFFIQYILKYDARKPKHKIQGNLKTTSQSYHYKGLITVSTSNMCYYLCNATRFDQRRSQAVTIVKVQYTITLFSVNNWGLNFRIENCIFKM